MNYWKINWSYDEFSEGFAREIPLQSVNQFLIFVFEKNGCVKTGNSTGILRVIFESTLAKLYKEIF